MPDADRGRHWPCEYDPLVRDCIVWPCAMCPDRLCEGGCGDTAEYCSCPPDYEVFDD